MRSPLSCSVNDPAIFETIEIENAVENIEYQHVIIVDDIDNESDELYLSIVS